MKSGAVGFFSCLGFLIYIALGVLQFWAILDGVAVWLSLNIILAIPLAILLAYIPVVGTLLGILAAVQVWHWSWLGAISLFLWPFILAGILIIGVGGFAAASLGKLFGRGK